VLITYNQSLNRFELQLQSGQAWQAEMELAKSVGFKCDGPPSWTWATVKALIVAKLRENRPTSGLEITPQALEIFNQELPKEQANEKIIEQVKQIKTEQRKREKKQQHIEELLTSIPEYWRGKDEIGREDLPLDVIARCSEKTQLTIPKPPDITCQYCHVPVYMYEKQDPPTCIWCEAEYDKFQQETGL
jgi:hypothetical protein